jgi:hypothetical protein
MEAALTSRQDEISKVPFNLKISSFFSLYLLKVDRYLQLLLDFYSFKIETNIKFNNLMNLLSMLLNF